MDYNLSSQEIDKVVLILLDKLKISVSKSTIKAMEDLLERFEGKVKVNFRFTVNLKEPESISNKMVKHIISLRLQNHRNVIVHYLIGICLAEEQTLANG